MIQKDELKRQLRDLSAKMKNIGESLDLPSLSAEHAELSLQMQAENFWNDVSNAQRVSQRAKNIEYKMEEFQKLNQHVVSVEELLEMCGDTDEDELLVETNMEMDYLKKEVGDMHIAALLKGKFDPNNAILTLHAGAGGTESQDWVSMLYRMYCRYCEKRKYKLTILDMLDGDEAGIKSVTFMASGMNAYGYLKAEKGVHRLVRISPFDANKRRHTSFASLEVMPEIENDLDVVIEDKDLRVDTYRSSGAGGQHVNKTESAIRLTHIPTGCVVSCQTERSQIQNRETAMKMLKSKLVEIKERQQMEEALSIKGEIKRIEWGSQIRSYVFCPYTLVKDHRTGFENSNIDVVMDGEIQSFIEDYLAKAM